MWQQAAAGNLVPVTLSPNPDPCLMHNLGIPPSPQCVTSKTGSVLHVRPKHLPIVVKCAGIGPNLWHPSLAACYNNVCRRRVVLLLEWINNALWKIYPANSTPSPWMQVHSVHSALPVDGVFCKRCIKCIVHCIVHSG